jgi:uncharacterized membrane protein (DUF106 family)
MDEKRYWIRATLLRQLAEFAKILSGAYHTMARQRFWGTKRLREMADEADEAAEAAKEEMRKQDGQE